MASKSYRRAPAYQRMPGDDDRMEVLGHLRYEIERMAGECASERLTDAQRAALLLHVKRLSETVEALAQEDHPKDRWRIWRDWRLRDLIEYLLYRATVEPRNIPRGNETGAKG